MWTEKCPLQECGMPVNQLYIGITQSSGVTFWYFSPCEGAVALTLGAVPDGAGQIWLDNVNCRGSETRLIDCPANPLGIHNCVHSEDAGVRCLAGTSFSTINSPFCCCCCCCCCFIVADVVAVCCRLQPRCHQAARWYCSPWTCRGLQQRHLGHSVWWHLGSAKCPSGVSTAGALNNRYRFPAFYIPNMRWLSDLFNRILKVQLRWSWIYHWGNRAWGV